MVVACSAGNVLAYVTRDRINFLKVDASLGDPSRSWHIQLGGAVPKAAATTKGEAMEIVSNTRLSWSGTYLALWNVGSALVTLISQVGNFWECYSLSEAILDCFPCPVEQMLLPGCNGFVVATRAGDLLQLCQTSYGGSFRIVAASSLSCHREVIGRCEQILCSSPWIVGGHQEGVVLATVNSDDVRRKYWPREGHRLMSAHNLGDGRLVLAERSTNAEGDVRIILCDLRNDEEPPRISQVFNFVRDALFLEATNQVSLLLEGNGGIIIMDYEEGRLVHKATDLMPLTLPLSDGSEGPLAFCLDQSGALFLVFHGDGSVSKCPRRLENIVQHLTKAINSGRGGWGPLLDQLATKVAMDQANGQLIGDILKDLSPSLRKAHQFAILSEIILRVDSTTEASDLAWFCYQYYRLAHYWEVVIAGTVDMASTIKALERDGGKLGSNEDITKGQRSSSERSGEERQPGTSIEFLFECIPSLQALTLEIIDVIRLLFAAELPQSRQLILKRALRIATIHHRLTSCMRLVGAYRRCLQRLHKKYLASGVSSRPLATYFGDLLGSLNEAGRGFDWQAAFASLHSIPQEPPLGLDYLFIHKGEVPESFELYAAPYDVSDRIVTRVDRDPVTGTLSGTEVEPHCLLCNGVRAAEQELGPIEPIWTNHYYFCCACGCPTNCN